MVECHLLKAFRCRHITKFVYCLTVGTTRYTWYRMCHNAGGKLKSVGDPKEYPFRP